MKLFGYELALTKSVPAGVQTVSDHGWWPAIREPFTGAWQRNIEQRVENLTSFHALYSCVTLIAQDVSKMRLRLVQQDASGIWSETTSPSFSPVLRKPNNYQTRVKFFEQWIVSKLLHGNTYVLKERDARGVVTDMYILDPVKTKALVAPDGSVFYRVSADNLANVSVENTFPASEIIHDTCVPLFHPLCGVSPITACGLAASQGLSIQRNSHAFFANGSRPGGILTAPGKINNDTADRIKQHWQKSYTGENAGQVAVLGDGLTYVPMVMTAVDAQLIDQLKWSATNVAGCYHVPPHLINVGETPKYDNVEALNQQYYNQCLQSLLENIEALLDEGLGLVNVPGVTYGTEFDLDDLLRMDTGTMVDAIANAVKSGIMKPDEARKKLGYGKTPGGDTPYLQEQNYSLAALAKRDAQADPFATTPAKPAETPTPPAQNDNVAAQMAGSVHRAWEGLMISDRSSP